MDDAEDVTVRCRTTGGQGSDGKNHGPGDSQQNGECQKDGENDGGESEMTEKPWIDGGWAWAVASGGLLTMYAAIGQMRCLGLFFAEIQTVFNEGSTVSSILPSILFVLAPVMCLLSSAIAALWGTRCVVIVGVVISVGGYVLASFSANITQFIIFYGIPTGIGIGLIYTPSQILVAQYFVKYSALSQGIMNTGSSIAGISLPYLFSYLSEIYGFRGAMLILGGILANTMIAAFLFRPLEFWEKHSTKSIDKAKYTKNANGVIGDDVANKDLNPEAQGLIQADDVHLLTSNGDAKPLHKSASIGSSIQLETSYNIAPTGSMIIYGEVLSASRASLEKIHQQIADADTKTNNTTTSKVRHIFNSIKRVTNFSLVKSPAFLVHTMSACCGFVSYMIMSTILPSHSIELGMSERDSYGLISIGAAAEIPSRLLITFLADKYSMTKYGHKFHVMSLGMLISGVVSILTAYATTYVELAVYFSIHSFCMGGGFLALNVDVLREAIGLDKLSNGGLGLSLLFTGVMSGTFPIIAGAMRDIYGNYIGAMLLIGAFGFLGGTVLWLQVIVKRYEARNAQQDQRV